MRNWVPHTQQEWRRLLVGGLFAFLLGGAVGFALQWPLAWNNLSKARKALDEYRVNEARDYLARCLHYQPGNKEAHLLLARVCWQLEQYEEAEEHLHRCEQLHGKQTEEVQFEYLLLRTMQGDIKARQLLEPYLKKEGREKALIYEATSHAWLKTGHSGNARQEADVWIALEPENARAYVARARSHLRVGNTSFAKPDLETAVKLAPDDDEARFLLADALLSQHFPEQAVKHFERLRQASASSPVSHMLVLLRLGECYRNIPGQREKASACIDEVLEAYPDHPLALQVKGNLAFDAKKYADAASIFERILAADGLFFTCYLDLSSCYRELGQLADAGRCLEMFQSLDRDLKQLTELTDTKLKMSPHDADLLYEVGQIYLRNGRTFQALDYLNRALVEDPQHAATHRLLADYYGKLGEFEMQRQHVPNAGAARGPR
jgi:tetratricopeptide (TPR) repeat protein